MAYSDTNYYLRRAEPRMFLPEDSRVWTVSVRVVVVIVQASILAAGVGKVLDTELTVWAAILQVFAPLANLGVAAIALIVHCARFPDPVGRKVGWVLVTANALLLLGIAAYCAEPFERLGVSNVVALAIQAFATMASVSLTLHERDLPTENDAQRRRRISLIPISVIALLLRLIIAPALSFFTVVVYGLGGERELPWGATVAISAVWCGLITSIGPVVMSIVSNVKRHVVARRTMLYFLALTVAVDVPLLFAVATFSVEVRNNAGNGSDLLVDVGLLAGFVILLALSLTMAAFALAAGAARRDHTMAR